MNTVILNGKIAQVRKYPKVTYITIHCRDGKYSEYLDVTLFASQAEFFDRYFLAGNWITIQGRIHKNKEQDYKQEIICQSIHFSSDAATEPDTPNNPTADEDNAHDDFVDFSDDEDLPF
jgi:aspartyl/asparaginyl-tRNA synthetase